MKDKIFMILLGIIAVNLTIQTVKDVGLFSTAYAQNPTSIQRVMICDGQAQESCARVITDPLGIRRLGVVTQPQFN